MDFGTPFYIAAFVIILLSMFAADSKSKSAKRERDEAQSEAPRRIVIETLDNKGQVIKREAAHFASGPDRAQGAPKARGFDGMRTR